MINVAIAGFGQVGKSLFNIVNRSDTMRVVALFSSRKFLAECPVYGYGETPSERIDVVALCLSSSNQSQLLAPSFAEKFSTVDCFDNTDAMPDYKAKMRASATFGNNCCLVGCGWDPGLFDVERKLFSLLGDVTCRWGKGVSCGHTNAVKNVEGVLDGVSFTVPTTVGHKRFVYVSARDNHEEIRQKIMSIPHYFLGLDTRVEFVDDETVKRLKQDKSHKGEVRFESVDSRGELKISMQSNPDFTAKVMFACLTACKKLKESGKIGAFDMTEFPLCLLN